MENNDLISSEMLIDGYSASNLKETASWAKFLGVLGFVYSVIISVMSVVAGYMLQEKLSKLDSTGASSAAMMTGVVTIGVIYFVLAVIVFFSALYLFRFGTKMQVAISTNDQENLNTAFRNLKNYFRFIGVVSLISIIFTVFGIIGIIGTLASLR